MIHIGTSGWMYPHWQGPVYPSELPAGDWLTWYSHRFNSVEINNTFYQIPASDTVRSWRAAVPPDFVFAVKASRYITHMKKLRDPADTLPGLLERAQDLEGQLGPILFQLPPRWRCNRDRLTAFLDHLPAGGRYVMEFRDSSWWSDEILELLQSRNVGFCIYELADRKTPREKTADFVYIRLHGPGEAYRGSYSIQALSEWAEAIDTWHRQGLDVFCFFDNDEQGHAVEDAGQLRKMTGNGTGQDP